MTKTDTLLEMLRENIAAIVWDFEGDLSYKNAKRLYKAFETSRAAFDAHLVSEGIASKDGFLLRLTHLRQAAAEHRESNKTLRSISIWADAACLHASLLDARSRRRLDAALARATRDPDYFWLGQIFRAISEVCPAD